MRLLLIGFPEILPWLRTRRCYLHPCLVPSGTVCFVVVDLLRLVVPLLIASDAGLGSYSRRLPFVHDHFVACPILVWPVP